MNRPRGPGGRFLTADEVAAMENDEKLDEAEGKPEGSAPLDLKPSKNGPAPLAAQIGGKRKADATNDRAGSETKKNKRSTSAEDEEDDEEVDDDEDA